MNEKEEGLLEGVGDRSRLVHENVELLFDRVRVVERPVAGVRNADRHAPKRARHGRIDEKTVGKQSVNVEDVLPADGDVREVLDDVLNRLLVVEDHHGFPSVPAGGLLPEADQALRLQDVVGVPLHAR